MSKITVIGDTNSGKTCFLYAMYNYIAQGRVDGFTISATDSDQDVRLTDFYEQMQDSSLGLDRFPPASDKRELYNFNLQYGFRSVANFEWVDYPGSYIKSQGEGSENLIYDLKASQAWVIFISGDKLANAILEENLRQRQNKLFDLCGKYNRFISKLAAENENYLPSTIPVIVTKGDILINSLLHSQKLSVITDIELRIRKATELIETAIQSGFSALFNEQNHSIKSISIVSLGDSISQDNYHGDLSPENIEYPIALSVISVLEANFEDDQRKINSFKRSIQKENERLFTRNGRLAEYNNEIKKISPNIERLQSMAKAILGTLAIEKLLWQGADNFKLQDYYKDKFLIVE